MQQVKLHCSIQESFLYSEGRQIICTTTCFNICFCTLTDFALVKTGFLTSLLWTDAFPFHLTDPKQLALSACDVNWQRWIFCYHRMSGWQSAPSLFVRPSITTFTAPAKWTSTPHHYHFIRRYLVDILSWKWCSICPLGPVLLRKLFKLNLQFPVTHAFLLGVSCCPSCLLC